MGAIHPFMVYKGFRRRRHCRRPCRAVSAADAFSSVNRAAPPLCPCRPCRSAFAASARAASCRRRDPPSLEPRFLPPHRAAPLRRRRPRRSRDRPIATTTSSAASFSRSTAATIAESPPPLPSRVTSVRTPPTPSAPLTHPPEPLPPEEPPALFPAVTPLQHLPDFGHHLRRHLPHLLSLSHFPQISSTPSPSHAPAVPPPYHCRPPPAVFLFRREAPSPFPLTPLSPPPVAFLQATIAGFLGPPSTKPLFWPCCHLSSRPQALFQAQTRVFFSPIQQPRKPCAVDAVPQLQLALSGAHFVFETPRADDPGQLHSPQVIGSSSFGLAYLNMF
ncbi:leucine-rich repeat extensin-like protein 5 [Phoenix dactylifera]|uniref:Leucine-rich repeat extensin-like protein 5 n=1 Tax=Phoenix dactylifera TaxID=42345 RepID=A0A8B9AJS5_PHODC|nr:leucine-rich repeat extensin-like protein 5 [Phoenix dactylifera]